MERKILKIARKTGKSHNRIILDMIYHHTDFKKKQELLSAASLRSLAGGWSEKEAYDFFESTKSSEQIDDQFFFGSSGKKREGRNIKSCQSFSSGLVTPSDK